MGATAGLTSSVSYGDSQKYALNGVALLVKPAVAPARSFSDSLRPHCTFDTNRRG
jgi:hypothetical protein